MSRSTDLNSHSFRLLYINVSILGIQLKNDFGLIISLLLEMYPNSNFPNIYRNVSSLCIECSKWAISFLSISVDMTNKSLVDPLHERDLSPQALALTNEIPYILSMLEFLNVLLVNVGRCEVEHVLPLLHKVTDVVIDILEAFHSVRYNLYNSFET